jgi:cell division protein FtsL
LRPLPFDDVFFYLKKVDNGRLVKQPDPHSSGACWTTIGAACLLLCALSSVAVPAVMDRMRGYRLEALRQEERRLLDESRLLDLDEAYLLSPARLEELATRRNLRRPSPGQVIHLDGKNDASLAMAK